ncbi:MAG: DegT/DnrJ/EryC1/StrS family aminotransferase, partial [Planctomycetota bacterium]
TFEERFAARHGATNALATTSGTAALHLAMTALGIGSGDEVIVPDFAFGGRANAVLHTGATPVFADVCPDTWTLDPVKVQAATTSSTKAILAAHVHGHPCDMDALNRVAKERDLFVIEDCAAALGARYKTRLVGTLADVACFSFCGDSVITTGGEGGMVLTTNPKLHQRMALLHDQGMARERRYWHEVAGFNYRMTAIQAAIGVAQLERLDEFLHHRRLLACRYQEQLQDLPGMHLPQPASWAERTYWSLTVLVDPGRVGLCRDGLVTGLARAGIESRTVFQPLHQQPAYPDSDEVFPVTDWISGAGLALPTTNAITLEDVDRICDVIRRLIRDGAVTAPQ